MLERLRGRDLGQLGLRPSPERATAGSQHQAGDPTGDVVGAEALVNRPVLAVDWDELGAGRGAIALDDGAGGDERLLVRQCKATTRLKGGDRDRETGEPNHAVHHDIGILGKAGERIGPAPDVASPGRNVQEFKMSIDPKRVQSIFVAAADLPTAGDRAAYLDQACAGNVELRHRVEALLQAHDHPDSYLEPPAVPPGGTVEEVAAAGPAAEATSTEQAGMVLAGRYKLRLAYSAQINKFGRGIYSIDYRTDDGRKRMIASHSEPSDARRIFPGWDEPAFKATFDLSVTVPERFMAVSNMPVVREEPTRNGRKRVSFERTPIMSTYLFVLVAGELERVTVPMPNGLKGVM